MSPSTVQETVTVTAEAPILNVATSNLGGNVDPTQVRGASGRRPQLDGARAFSRRVAARPLRPSTQCSPTETAARCASTDEPRRDAGHQQPGGGSQPPFSQEMIAEFQFISNRFDATQGRSQGVQVNVITKSGTNQMAGSLRANFRDDRFNAENQALGRKVPISNQQYAGSAGGPIIRDRLHYFGFYEYEREPRTSIWNTPYPRFNIELKGNVSKKLGGGRLDYQLSPQMRFMVRAT